MKHRMWCGFEIELPDGVRGDPVPLDPQDHLDGCHKCQELCLQERLDEFIAIAGKGPREWLEERRQGLHCEDTLSNNLLYSRAMSLTEAGRE